MMEFNKPGRLLLPPKVNLLLWKRDSLLGLEQHLGSANRPLDIFGVTN